MTTYSRPLYSISTVDTSPAKPSTVSPRCASRARRINIRRPRTAAALRYVILLGFRIGDANKSLTHMFYICVCVRFFTPCVFPRFVRGFFLCRWLWRNARSRICSKFGLVIARGLVGDALVEGYFFFPAIRTPIASFNHRYCIALLYLPSFRFILTSSSFLLTSQLQYLPRSTIYCSPVPYNMPFTALI